MPQLTLTQYSKQIIKYPLKSNCTNCLTEACPSLALSAFSTTALGWMRKHKTPLKGKLGGGGYVLVHSKALYTLLEDGKKYI